jgi:hypothetical protein
MGFLTLVRYFGLTCTTPPWKGAEGWRKDIAWPLNV